MITCIRYFLPKVDVVVVSVVVGSVVVDAVVEVVAAVDCIVVVVEVHRYE